MFMPKWAVRLWREVTDVQAQRLQDISGFDARAEGCEPDWEGFSFETEGMEGWEEPEEFIEECENECDWVNYGNDLVHSDEHKQWLRDREEGALRLAYRHLWDSLNAKRGYAWSLNHWVWRYMFKPIDGATMVQG